MKYLIVVIIFCLGIILGMTIYYKRWFPVPQLSKFKNEYLKSEPIPLDCKKIIISKYYSGVPLFSDRMYYDTIDNTVFDSCFVIQAPRHYNSDITINVSTPVTIYRFITNSNDNKIFSDWSKSNFNIYVKGESCTHNSVVEKKFNSGIINLKIGGPISASPILIKVHNIKFLEFPFKILNE